MKPVDSTLRLLNGDKCLRVRWAPPRRQGACTAQALGGACLTGS